MYRQRIVHHFIHNRVMYVTGATGAGKSSVYPFMMLYAQKIINYNNYAIVICSEPRIGPTKSNAERINNSLGLGGTGQEDFGIPNFESGDGDYDMLGNKINEITGEITSPEGQSLGFAPGYPGGPNSSDGGITTIPTSSGGSGGFTLGKPNAA